jgi:hypothetical protein
MFRKFGPIYLPSSISGAALCLWTALIAERSFVVIDRHSHSVSDTLLGAVPIAGTMLLLLWLLATTSARR